MKPRTNKYKEYTLLIEKSLGLDRLAHNEYILNEGLLLLEQNGLGGDLLKMYKYSTAYWDWFYHQWCIHAFNVWIAWNANSQYGNLQALYNSYFNQEASLVAQGIYPAEPIIEKIYTEYETRKADTKTNNALSKENRTIGIRAGRNFPEKERQATSAKKMAK